MLTLFLQYFILIGQLLIAVDFDLQGMDEEEEMKVKKYLRGEAADLGVMNFWDFYY